LSFLDEKDLLDSTQHVDWSAIFFQGQKAKIAKHGYSRDHRPDKKQVNFGVWIGNNNIPSILTIQKGNVVDKMQMNKTLKMIPKIFFLN